MTTKTFTFAPTDAITADIRAVELDGAWWFVAADVCRALDLKVGPDGSFRQHLRKIEAHNTRRIRAADLTRTDCVRDASVGGARPKSVLEQPLTWGYLYPISVP